jgi:hypothetical protein
MKRVVLWIALLAMLFASACTVQQSEETQEGQDGSPVVTVYQAPT